MDHAAIDLHKKESQIRILLETGEVIDHRVRTSRQALTEVFGGRPALRVLLEASTESEWVAQHLETLGHEAVVGDPNYAPMYGTRNRRIKTDLRDTAALTDACRQGTYRAVHRRSAAQRTRQWQLNVRDQLVRTRTRAISGVRAITRSTGARLPHARSAHVVDHVQALELPAEARAALTPLCELITHTSQALIAVDTHLSQVADGDPICRRLMSAPGIGPVTAVAFVAAIDDPRRFRTASQVAQYLGLVPQEASSGERQRRGHVLRSAQPRVQRLLVQAAWRVLRSPRPDAAALKTWAVAVATRRGRRIAVVALARRLARLLWAMWRDETLFRPASIRALKLEE
jgi:transposase